MYEFDIPDMSCGHCVNTVTKVIKATDPDAVANIDLIRRKVTVETKTDPGAIGAAMEDAGYPATFSAI
ncbi:heavy-metal-associated domain-containing protein [Rhizobium sp. KVB221]|uniref:Heavy-metal-associated domain-containing protein n=1 Tax=Rhizobium setariae TaxID=2801340 RepID=A0A936YUX3_9HYPH|nr:heavy-metal-associated domain-containing protein [Rhizobium setariae]MBL0375244.1 heavy-metal-associated domain-containing protein [Rhizobium setariae]